MKAKEYFLKYKDKFLDSKDQKELDATVVALLNDFNRDMRETMTKRGVSSDDAVVGSVIEFNNKWNALVRMFERHFHYSPIKYDGYLKYWDAFFGWSRPDLEKAQKATMPPQFKDAVERRTR